MQGCSHLHLYQPFVTWWQWAKHVVQRSASSCWTCLCKLNTWPCLLAGPKTRTVSVRTSVEDSSSQSLKLLFSRCWLLNCPLLHLGEVQEFYKRTCMWSSRSWWITWLTSGRFTAVMSSRNVSYLQYSGSFLFLGVTGVLKISDMGMLEIINGLGNRWNRYFWIRNV